MPGPPAWMSEEIMLPDAPDEPQKFFYHDLIKCAHYLFQWSDLAKHMNYIPMQVFNESKDHVYHEMVAGHEWKKQVSKNASIANTSDWLSKLEGAAEGQNYNPEHSTCFRQDTPHELFRG